MRLTTFFALIAATGACAPSAQAASSAELLDLAARVHYGYYHGEPQTIVAAEAALERLGATPDVIYYLDLAVLRRVQLGDRDRETLRRLEACARRQSGAELSGTAAAEAWVLAAACALEGDDGRRLAQALAAARAGDADHPRIALVEAWRLEKAGRTAVAEREALAVRWAGVVAAFDAFTPSLEDPGWGHAEALVALADNAWQRGEIRAARDLIERALLLAPDYRRAVELRAAVLGQRSGSRTP